MSEATEGETLPDSEPALRAIAMPADANPRGDLAGSTVAIRRAKSRVATVAVTSMTFRKPVFVGDEVSCYAEIVKVGTTSITVKIESWVRRGVSGEALKVTEGLFTYVAIDADRRPSAIRTEQ